MATTAEQLAELQAAISATLLSQEYTSKGIAQKRARLAEMTDREERLIARLKEETSNGGGMSSVGMIHPPS